MSMSLGSCFSEELADPAYPQPSSNDALKSLIILCSPTRPVYIRTGKPTGTDTKGPHSYFSSIKLQFDNNKIVSNKISFFMG